MARWFDKIWRKIFRRPQTLAVPVDYGKGQPVVFLHGLAADYQTWTAVQPQLNEQCRVIALDLLGFGSSPKPPDLEYNVQDHAKAVVATLKKLGVRRNAVLVGHSMGTLIAVEIARQKPKLAKQLILCSPPLFRFDKRHRLRPNQETLLVTLSRHMQREKFAMRTFKGAKRLRPDLKGWGLTKDTWIPFKESLQNTIMGQTTFDDIQRLEMPVDMLCGRFDGLVVRRHLQTLVKAMPETSLVWLNESHKITKRYGRRIAETVNRAMA